MNTNTDHRCARSRAGARRALVRGAATVLALTATLGLAACGGGDKKSDDKAAAGSGAIEDQLGFDLAGIMARQTKVEAAIRGCMKTEGFDYVPVDPQAQRAAATGSGRLSDEDFLQQFGYGISTLWGRGGLTADPNARIRRALSPADQRAYDQVLTGGNPGATFFAAVDSGRFDNLGGCTKKATEDVFGGSSILNQIVAKLDELDQKILEDQRMVRAVEQWTECMAEGGYRYEDPEEIDGDLISRMEKIVGPLPGAYFNTGPGPGEKKIPYDKAALAVLQRDEVAVARKDFACEKEHISPVEAKVRPQYEAAFRTQNQNLIGQVKPV
jgi:hypothetical protein